MYSCDGKAEFSAAINLVVSVTEIHSCDSQSFFQDSLMNKKLRMIYCQSSKYLLYIYIYTLSI